MGQLSAVHRALYSDYLHGQQKTGGGPCPKSISPITDAVMSVKGKQSASIREISEFVDTSILQLNSLSASSQVDNPLSSASIIRRQRVQVGRNDEPEEQSRSSFTATNMPSDVTECFAGNVLSSNYSVVQVVCCQCNCHKQLEILKEEKLRLQIRVLKRQLDEE